MSEEQLREYVERLRSSPAEQVVAGVLSDLLELARIKLGRNDARLFIDMCATLHEQVRPYVSTEFAAQVERALGDLRLAQVQAERSPERTDEPNDLAQAPQPAQPAPAGQPTPNPASKLWIPGRGL
jgi:hypothetical protein